MDVLTYRVNVTDPDDDDTILAVSSCQQMLVADHLALYTTSHPRASKDEWSQALNCGRIADFIRQGVVVLCLNDTRSNEVLGFLSYGIDGLRAHMYHFVVRPCKRGRGLGRLLWDALLERLGSSTDGAQRVHELHLGVAEKNQRVIAWYRQLGFVRIGRRIAPLGGPKAPCGRVAFMRMRRVAIEGMVHAAAVAPLVADHLGATDRGADGNEKRHRLETLETRLKPRLATQKRRCMATCCSD